MDRPMQALDRPMQKRERGVTPPKIDWEFVLKIIRRHWLPATLLFFMILSVGICLTFFVKNSYRSKVVASFSRNDSAIMNLEGGLVVGGERSDWNFETKMTDPYFLSKLGDYLNLDTTSTFQKLTSNFLPLPVESESDRNANLVSYFSKRLISEVNSEIGQLSLNIILDDVPEKSQNLAALAMESFITSELTSAASRLSVKIDALAAAMKRSQERLQDLRVKIQSGTNAQHRGAPTNTPIDVRQKESDLLDRIKASEREFAAVVDDQTKRRTILESEYQRLSARLYSTHPDLAAKRTELENTVNNTSAVENSARNLSRLRRELLLMRTDSMMPGLGILTDDPFNSMDGRLEVTQIASLKQSITELELERESLLKQAADPTLRTRLKVIRPATYEVKPVSRKKVQVLLASFVLAVFGSLFLVLLREVRSPIIRDAWRAYRATGVNVLAQLADISVKTYPRVSPHNADQMREKLSSLATGDRAAVRTLLSYRKVELSLLQQCEGKTVCVLSAGTSDVTSDFLYSLANIIATDTGRKILVIDGNANDPIIKMIPKSAPDFIDNLVEQRPVLTSVIKGDESRSFDLLAVNKPMLGRRTRALAAGFLVPCFKELESLYDLILVRSLPESHFIENVEIVSACSDLVVGIDAQRTTFFDLARNLDQIGDAKLRGLILVGT
ncbi:MAG: hypothetical protein WCI18_06960 [Pseudomonadota bacterium]